jgi:hypothetical protein
MSVVSIKSKCLMIVTMSLYKIENLNDNSMSDKIILLFNKMLQCAKPMKKKPRVLKPCLLTSLPFDMLEEISNKLDPKSLNNLKATCKLCSKIKRRTYNDELMHAILNLYTIHISFYPRLSYIQVEIEDILLLHFNISAVLLLKYPNIQLVFADFMKCLKKLYSFINQMDINKVKIFYNGKYFTMESITYFHIL